jgi:glutamine amidotransferase
VALENTHPFVRELWGRSWVFAHNGELKGIKQRKLKHYRAIGTTDSEHAFCWMLDQVRERFSSPPKPRQLWRHIEKLGEDLGRLGIFNFLLSDGRYLYTRCHTDLAWITRRAPFGAAQLADVDFDIDFSKETTLKDVVTVVATRPLTTNETWNIMSSGEFTVFDDGEPVFSVGSKKSASD